MRYEKPELVAASSATTLIQGAKRMVLPVDINDPGSSEHFTAPAYEADE
jgi:hypothetical protein